MENREIVQFLAPPIKVYSDCMGGVNIEQGGNTISIDKGSLSEVVKQMIIELQVEDDPKENK